MFTASTLDKEDLKKSGNEFKMPSSKKNYMATRISFNDLISLK